MDYLTFAVIMLLGQFSPGPDMLLLLRNALAHPRRAGLMTVLGIVAGLCLHTTLALAGLAALVRDSTRIYATLLMAGGGWLLWLAFRLLRAALTAPDAGPAVQPEGTRRPLADRNAFLQGFVTNLTNAKAIVFLASILVSALGPEPSPVRKIIFFLIVTGQALVFWSLFVAALQHAAVERLYLRSERVINGLFGLALGAVALEAFMEGVRLAVGR